MRLKGWVTIQMDHGKVKYFDSEAVLAQSPQFYKQMGVGAFERVFEVGPVFRAEPHFTSRHVNEYISLDAVVAGGWDHNVSHKKFWDSNRSKRPCCIPGM